MKLGRRIAMDPTAVQAGYCWRAAGVNRFAWNWGKARWDADWAKAKAEPDNDKRKTLWPSTQNLKAEWAEVRRKDFPWSLDVTKCAGTQAIIDLGATFARAQKERREAKAQKRKPRPQFGFPRFKAKNKTLPSFALWNDQISVCNHYSLCGKPYATVRIPNLGEVRLREPVPSMGGILGARVSFRRGRWFIAFQCDLEWNDGEQSDKAAQIAQGKARKTAVAAGMSAEEAKQSINVEAARPTRLLPIHPRPGTIGGADLGLIDALVGQVEQASGVGEAQTFRVPNPRRLNRTEKEMRTHRRRQRRLSRSIQRARERTAREANAKRGDSSPVTAEELRGVRHRLSNRQCRLSAQLAKQPWAEADRREDFLHKTALQTVRSAEIVVLEDLHVAGMMRNHALARHLSDAALGRLGTYITYKAEREGGLVLAAPRFFPSSKRCSACGLVCDKLDLSLREWDCAGCGAHHDRDSNAAANLCWLGHLAYSDGDLAKDAYAWAEWVQDARAKVAAWRQAKAMPRDFSAGADDAADCVAGNECVGPARSEVTRGETVYRGRRKSAREPAAEPRTKTGRASPTRGRKAHISSLIG